MEPTDKPHGYHVLPIHKGKLGEISKINEELEELHDASIQGNKILELCELADLVGAIQAYLVAKHPGTTLEHLKIMAEATARAFQAGERK